MRMRSVLPGALSALAKRKRRTSLLAVAVTAAVAAAIAVLVTANGTLARPAPGTPPDPNGWIYTKSEDSVKYASHAGKTQTSQDWVSVRSLGTGKPPGTWQGSTYSYFSSLPTDPVKLIAIIDTANKAQGYPAGSGALGVFNDVMNALLWLPYLPPKLSAAFYAVLAGQPGVRFQPYVTDIAGRTDAAFSIDQGGGTVQEILINRKTYAYMGEIFFLYSSGSLSAVAQPQITTEYLQLQSAIVQGKGQVP
jgi:hypothetical protein